MPEWPNARLLFRDNTGATIARFNDFAWLTSRREVNGADKLKFELAGQHRHLSKLATDRLQVELWRRDPAHGLDWYREFSGLYRAEKDTRPTARLALATCLGDKSLLARRIVAWYAGFANRSAFASVPGETIMKNLVKYNITSSATTGAPGRTRAGTNWPAGNISIDTDAGGGNTIDWYCAGDNLLETLQALAKVAGGDFDLVKTANPLDWKFHFYPGQLGTDRSATLTFAVGRGNMAEPAYELDREDEATVAIVGGEGTGSARTFVTRTSSAFGTTNDIEIFVNGSNNPTSGGLNAAGDKRLAEHQAREEFRFGLLQTDSCVYQRDFGLGDLATAVNPFTGESGTYKINAITVDLQADGAQVITGEVATP